MKFKYYEAESKVLDLMQLPRILFIDDVDQNPKDKLEKEMVFKQLNETLFNDFEQLRKDVSLFKDEIELFYAQEFLSNYDFFYLLTKVYPILGFDSVKAYCESLLNEEPEALKTMIIYSIMTTEDEEETLNLTIKKEANFLATHQEKLLPFVKELPTTQAYKWNLLLMLEDVKNHIVKYRDLMEKLAPIYENIYKKHYDYLLKVKDRVLNKISDSDGTGFEAITQNLISKDILSKEDNKLLISLVGPLSFMFKSDLQDNYIVWGIEMEEGFKLVSSTNENRIMNQAQFFKNLGDKTRYEVLRLIANGITSTKEIAEKLGVSSATISYHINAFLTTNVLKMSKQKNKRYVVDYEQLNNYWETFINDLNPKNTKSIH